MHPSLKPLLATMIGSGNQTRMQALWNLGLPQFMICLAVTRVPHLPKMVIAPLLPHLLAPLPLLPVLFKKKAVPGKGTQLPITTLKQSAKKRCTVKMSGKKK